MGIRVKNIVFIILVLAHGFASAQEKLETPSQKTKEAVDKLLRVPSIVDKRLRDSNNAAKAKFQDAVSETKSAKTNSDVPAAPDQKADLQPPANFSTLGKRDPFRPSTLNTRI